MKPVSYRRHRARQMRRDTFILLTPVFLTLVGMLWFFREEWAPSSMKHVPISFKGSLLALLTNSL